MAQVKLSKWELALTSLLWRTMSQKWKRIKEVKSAFSRAKNSDQYIVLSISIWYIKCYNEQCWFIIARVLQRLFYKKKTLYLWIDLFYKVLQLYLLDFKIIFKVLLLYIFIALLVLLTTDFLKVLLQLFNIKHFSHKWYTFIVFIVLALGFALILSIS